MSLFDAYPESLSTQQTTIEGHFEPSIMIDKQLKFAWTYLKSYWFKHTDFERRQGFEIYIYSNKKTIVQVYARNTGFFPDYWPVIRVEIKESKQE